MLRSARVVLLACGAAHAAAAAAAAAKETPSKEYKYRGVEFTGEHVGVLPRGTGVDFSAPNQALCDGCLSTVEQFHLQWLRYVSKESRQGDDIDQQSAGSKPPAITYNDEVEDLVNDICKSKSYRDTGLTPQVTEVCQSMMGEEAIKRKVVAQFLAKDLDAKNLPERKRKLCEEGGVVNACAKDTPYAFDIFNSTPCGLCTAVVSDALFDARRMAHRKGAWKAQSIWAALDNLCTFTVLRHGEERADPVYELCERMMDEHDEDIIRAIVKLGKGGTEDAKVVRKICGEEGGVLGVCAEGGTGNAEENGKKGTKQKKRKKKKKRKKGGPSKQKKGEL